MRRDEVFVGDSVIGMLVPPLIILAESLSHDFDGEQYNIQSLSLD